MPVLGGRCSGLPGLCPSSRLLQLVICPEKLCASAIVALLQPPPSAFERLENWQKFDWLQQEPVSFSYTTTHDASWSQIAVEGLLSLLEALRCLLDLSALLFDLWVLWRAKLLRELFNGLFDLVLVLVERGRRRRRFIILPQDFVIHPWSFKDLSPVSPHRIQRPLSADETAFVVTVLLSSVSFETLPSTDLAAFPADALPLSVGIQTREKAVNRKVKWNEGIFKFNQMKLLTVIIEEKKWIEKYEESNEWTDGGGSWLTFRGHLAWLPISIRCCSYEAVSI